MSSVAHVTIYTISGDSFYFICSNYGVPTKSKESLFLPIREDQNSSSVLSNVLYTV